MIDMPLNSIPPTTTVENLHIKTDAARGQTYVDVGFYGGVIPTNVNDLIPLVKEGVKGFKCFMIESGVDEFPCVNEEEIKAAMEKFSAFVASIHDEDFRFPPPAADAAEGKRRAG